MPDKIEWEIAPCLWNSRRRWVLQSRTPPCSCWTPVLYTRTAWGARRAYKHMQRKPIRLR